jgi:glucose-6-phosphate 1-dehydrogenase
MVGHQVELLASQGVTDEMDAYGRLLGDAMKGDPLLFARQDAVEAEWRIVTPILTSPTPPHEYQPGSWGPAEADRLVARSGGWHKPQPAPADADDPRP